MNGGTTGSIPPTHTSGQQWDSAQGGQGVRWEYRDPGYGFVRLTARGADPVGAALPITNITPTQPPVVTVTGAAPPNGVLVFIKDVIGMSEVNSQWFRVHGAAGSTFQLYQDDTDGDGTNGPVDGTDWDAYTSGGTADARLWTATADVVVQSKSRTVNRLPSTVVFSHHVTSIWAVGAWNDRDGYPATGSFFRGRLGFSRNGNDWESVSQDFETFTDRDPTGQVTSDMAISVIMQKTDAIVDRSESTDLLLLTKGGEAVMGPEQSGQSARTFQHPDQAAAPARRSRDSEHPHQ